MMKNLKWIFLCALSILFFACNSDDATTETSTTVTAAKLLSVERTASNSLDIELKIAYDYENDHVQRLSSTEFSGNSVFSDEALFVYANNELQSVNGFLIEYGTDTFTLTTDFDREVYHFNGNKLNKVEVFDRLGTDFMLEDIIYYTYDNQGNTSRIDIHNGQDMLINYVTGEYDSNPTPFSSINNPINWLIYNEYADGNSNNVVNYKTYDASSNLIEMTTFEYTYNDNGFPVERKETSTISNDTEVVYEYFTYDE